MKRKVNLVNSKNFAVPDTKGTHHVHDRDPGTVELVHSPFRRHTDGRNEQAALFLNHNVDEFREGAVGVVVVLVSSKRGSERG